jgi:DNA-binding response OmpR family regulator
MPRDRVPEAGRLPTDEGVLRDTTLLVVDDDRKLVSLVRMYLEHGGFQVIAAYDGAQALTLAARHSPQFLILDLMLPGIDGISVCRQIRRTSSAPGLILTAKVEETEKLPSPGLTRPCGRGPGV